MTPSRRALLGAVPALALAACSRPDAAAKAAQLPPLKAVAPFPVGACVATGELGDPQFVELVRRNFTQLTPEWEMKMERILAADGSMRFDAADQIAEFCRISGLRLHGTTLVWYAQDPPAFEALKDNRTAFAAKLGDYVHAVMSRYRGLARGWDVLNEAVAENGDGFRGGVWAAGLGEDYGRIAFEMARDADPTALLFLNDYNLELMPAKLDAFQRLLERLLKAGAPVTGLGTQSHLDISTKPGQAGIAIQALARFGLPIHVSELDISTRPLLLGADKLLTQARIVTEIAEAFAELPERQRYAFTVWGVRDKDSWLRGPNGGDPDDQPLLFDVDGAPKAMLAAVETAFRRAR